MQYLYVVLTMCRKLLSTNETKQPVYNRKTAERVKPINIIRDITRPFFHRIALFYREILVADVHKAAIVSVRKAIVSETMSIVSDRKGFVFETMSIVSVRKGFVSETMGIVSDRKGFVSETMSIVSDRKAFVSETMGFVWEKKRVEEDKI